jgi:hypothetical protein
MQSILDLTVTSDTRLPCLAFERSVNDTELSKENIKALTDLL